MLALGDGAACLLVQKGCVMAHTSPLWRRHVVVTLLYARVAVDNLNMLSSRAQRMTLLMPLERRGQVAKVH